MVVGRGLPFYPPWKPSGLRIRGGCASPFQSQSLACLAYQREGRCSCHAVFTPAGRCRLGQALRSGQCRHDGPHDNPRQLFYCPQSRTHGSPQTLVTYHDMAVMSSQTNPSFLERSKRCPPGKKRLRPLDTDSVGYNSVRLLAGVAKPQTEDNSVRPRNTYSLAVGTQNR
ncbi:hypothetical protein LX36DRAFT_30148 [Colletotrichum falcatum]|nr:hypothetical protein LX36DRAFT_30148 [Colletotrichum falcatum]